MGGSPRPPPHPKGHPLPPHPQAPCPPESPVQCWWFQLPEEPVGVGAPPTVSWLLPGVPNMGKQLLYKHHGIYFLLPC